MNKGRELHAVSIILPRRRNIGIPDSALCQRRFVLGLRLTRVPAIPGSAAPTRRARPGSQDRLVRHQGTRRHAHRLPTLPRRPSRGSGHETSRLDRHAARSVARFVHATSARFGMEITGEISPILAQAKYTAKPTIKAATGAAGTSGIAGKRPCRLGKIPTRQPHRRMVGRGRDRRQQRHF